VPCACTQRVEELVCCTAQNAGARPPGHRHGVGGAIEWDRIGPGCGLRVLGALGLQERLLACFQRLGRSSPS
jgi:hypothetical protein